MKNLVCKTNHVSLLLAFSMVSAAGTASAQTDNSQSEAAPAAQPAPAALAAPTAQPAPASAAPAMPAAVPAQVPTQPAAAPGSVDIATAAPATEPVAPGTPLAPAAPALPVIELTPPEPIAPTPATTEPVDAATPLHISGSFFSRYELRDGYAEQGLAHPRLHREGDNIVYRARLGFATNPVSIGASSSIQAVFVPQAYGTHSTQGTPETIADGYDLGVYEAYVGLQGERLRLDVGRFAMDYGDALVIGNLGWNEAARAFQGARVHYASPKKYWIDFFGTLIEEGRPETREIGDGDRYFYGVYAALGGLFSEMDLDVYFLGQSGIGRDVNVEVDPEADPDIQKLAGASEFTFGARAKQKVGIVDYRVEAGLQFGSVQGAAGASAIDKFAYQADGEVGVAPATGLRVAVGGLVASGNDPSTADKDEGWNELYPTGHKFLGLADVFGQRTNALSANASVSYKPADALILKVDGHLLSRMEENANKETFTGSEVDVNVISPIGKGVVVRGMYAAFLPNADYWPEDRVIHYLEVQFGYDFK